MYFDGRLWAMMAGVRWRVAAAVALGLVAMGVGILRFVFLGRMLALVFNGAPVRSIAGAAAATAACVLLRAWLDHRRTVLAQHTAGQVQARLRARLFDRIAALGPAWFSGERTGGVMLAVVDGVEQLQTFFGVYLPQLVIAACAPVMIFAVLAWWDVPTAAILLAGALVTLALPQLVHRADRRAALARSAAFNAFGEEFLDAVQGLPTLKAFGQGAAFGEKLARKARALSDSTFWVLALGLLTRLFTDLGTGLGAAAAVAVGAWRVRHGDMSLEALLIVLMAGSEIFRPLRDLRGVLHQGMIGQSAANAIHALLDARGAAPAAVPRVTGLRPDLAFDGVRFAYPGRRADAHAALSFAVREGETVAIVGPSGAGKSTIVRLLLRQHDAQGGAIRIGGHDVRALDPDQVREMIAVVAQDATLFDGSVADNLRLGRPDANDADMIAAARAANAHDFIMALPDGYATRIGERGLMLSGGQRQRIAIARALLRDAPILLLDEALSSVDAENEALIQQALDRLTRGRTTLVLAHRLSSVIGADRILVLDQGQVVDTGTHAELIARDGPYRRLMGPQLEAAAESVGAAATAGATARASAGPQVRPLDDDAAMIGWPETLRTLLRFVRPWKGKVALTVLCGIGRVLGFIGVGVIGALVVGAVSAGRPSAALVAALLAVAPLAAVLHWLESWLAHDMAYRLLAEMRIALFATLERLAPAGLLRRRSGDLVALATQDVETVEYFYAHTLAPAFVALLVPAGVLALLAAVAWPLALVLLPFLLWAGLAPVLARRDVDRLGSRARDALGQLGAHLTETIQGLAELTAFQALARRREAFVAEVDAYGKQRAKLLDDLSAQSAALEIASGLGGLAVAALGALLCARGGFPREALPLLVLVAVAAFMPVAEIGQVARQLADTIASTRRLRALEQEPVTVADGTQAMPGNPTVRFEETGFTYPGRGVPAIDRVSFDVPPGSTVALVGPSGAGKSTVASLLLRFWDPQHGRVTLGGVDLRDLRLDDLRQHIALVAQDTYLFNDTLEANIRLAANDASAADVQRAIDHAALGEFVARLPDGLATRVGERGVQLSGGQRQRVAIARAFLKDAPVLILDEATSHLDTISEQQIRAALEGLMAHRTSIIIAHRLSTVRNADLILVIEHGRVVEAGRHAELIARQGAYARLVSHQASGVAA